MLISKEVEVKLNNRTVKHYEDLGYKIPKYYNKKTRKMEVEKGTTILAKVEDLTRGCRVEIEILCDYCLEEGKETIIKKPYHEYDNRRNGFIDKDCCNNCRTKKIQEVWNLKYNGKHPQQTKEVQEKTKNTCNERYGANSPLEVPEFLEQIKATNFELYGFENYAQTNEFREKCIKTSLERYGTEYPAQNPEIYAKNIKTNLERYGVESVAQAPEVRDKIARTLFKNGTQKSSKQQTYLNNLLKGKLNFPVNHINLDIAFPELQIYIEYDGSGHELNIIYGTMTDIEFKQKEINRGYFLRGKGWKEIRIISMQDFLPLDEEIFKMIEFAKRYLSTGHSWIKFDIDNSKIICSQFEQDYDFGELRKIKDKDLKEAG